MSEAVDVVEQYFKDQSIRYQRTEDEVEISFFGYPVAERYRILYLEESDALLISSHGVAYPKSGAEDRILSTVLSWNHQALGACWSFDQERRAICADATVYLAGSPLVPAQFDRYFNGLVGQVRRKLPELLRMVVEDPPEELDPQVKAQLERILEQQSSDDCSTSSSEPSSD